MTDTAAADDAHQLVAAIVFLLIGLGTAATCLIAPAGSGAGSSGPAPVSLMLR